MTRRRRLQIWRAKFHFFLRPYKRGFYDGFAASRGDPPYFGY